LRKCLLQAVPSAQRVVGKALRARNPGGDDGLPLQGREHGVEETNDERRYPRRGGGRRAVWRAARPRRERSASSGARMIGRRGGGLLNP
jgi:hypothetical protein